MILPKNIMIVEDEVITQRYLKEVLNQYEVNVTGCFDNAKEALEALKNISCDMVLMDININGAMDGIQLARKILQSYKLPIVFISAYSDDETLDEVLELSPYGFITKPFSSKEIHVSLQIAYKRFLMTHEVSVPAEIKTVNELLVLNESYTFDLKRSALYYRKDLVKLNVNQNKCIEILAHKVNDVVTFDTLVSNIWGTDLISDSALRTLVYSIRKAVPGIPLYSHSKKGYYLSSL